MEKWLSKLLVGTDRHFQATAYVWGHCRKLALQKIDTDPAAVVVLGTTPPPVTGMTLLTQQVVCGLERSGDVSFFNWSTGRSRRGLKFRIARVSRILRSLVWLVWHGRVGNSRLYAVANSKAGLYLTAALVWLARRLGYTVYLHHHTYYYIERFDWRMAWINRTLGSHGVHVVHSRQMANDFHATYATRCRFAFVYPSVVTTTLSSPRNQPSNPFKLGHLSNLSQAKGLDLVFDTLRELLDGGYDVRLKLAGPYHVSKSRRMVEKALTEFGDRVEYVGPVYGKEKTGFLGCIDCFLFPSRSESWGIVLHEAMAMGVPVVTYDRGCTKTVVGGQGGLVIDRHANFPLVAALQVEKWINDMPAYAEASQAAIDYAAQLQQEGQRSLDDFVQHMFFGTLRDLYCPVESYDYGTPPRREPDHGLVRRGPT